MLEVRESNLKFSRVSFRFSILISKPHTIAWYFENIHRGKTSSENFILNIEETRFPGTFPTKKTGWDTLHFTFLSTLRRTWKLNNFGVIVRLAIISTKERVLFFGYRWRGPCFFAPETQTGRKCFKGQSWKLTIDGGDDKQFRLFYFIFFSVRLLSWRQTNTGTPTEALRFTFVSRLFFCDHRASFSAYW